MGHSASRRYIRWQDLDEYHQEAVHRLSLKLGPAFLACVAGNASGCTHRWHCQWQTLVTRIYDLLLHDEQLNEDDRERLWRAAGRLRHGATYPIHWIYEAPASWARDARGLYRLHRDRRGHIGQSVQGWNDWTRQGGEVW